MPTTIQVPDELYRRLKHLARPFVDHTPADVVAHLVEVGEQSEPGGSERPGPTESLTPEAPLNSRAPRDRGASFEIDGQVSAAHSVPDLFEQVLKFLVKNGHLEQLRQLAPYRTSNQRYLFAQHPVHPNGNAFRIPVSHGGFHMEAHKSYYTALKQLKQFLPKCGVSFRYLGA